MRAELFAAAPSERPANGIQTVSLFRDVRTTCANALPFFVNWIPHLGREEKSSRDRSKSNIEKEKERKRDRERERERGALIREWHEFFSTA